jgi:hypothetical protein
MSKRVNLARWADGERLFPNEGTTTPRDRIFATAKKLRSLKDELMMAQQPDATTVRVMTICDYMADALIDLQIQVESLKAEKVVS